MLQPPAAGRDVPSRSWSESEELGLGPGALVGEAGVLDGDLATVLHTQPRFSLVFEFAGFSAGVVSCLLFLI